MLNVQTGTLEQIRAMVAQDQRLRAGVSSSIRRLAPSYCRIHTIKDGTGISIVGGAEPLGKAAASGCQFRTRRCGVAHVCHRRAAPVAIRSDKDSAPCCSTHTRASALSTSGGLGSGVPVQRVQVFAARLRFRLRRCAGTPHWPVSGRLQTCSAQHPSPA